MADGRRVRGARTREVILARAADLASEEGLEALSIGRLAAELELSKSGLFAHFGSKEDLQLAVVRAARETFVAQVVAPALTVAAGVERLAALCENWLSYSERRVFPGGCFFAQANAEFDARPGPIRDELGAALDDWLRLLRKTAAQAPGVVGDGAEQLAFELYALLEAANSLALLRDDARAYARAREAIHERLEAGPDRQTQGQSPT